MEILFRKVAPSSLRAGLSVAIAAMRVPVNGVTTEWRKWRKASWRETACRRWLVLLVPTTQERTGWHGGCVKHVIWRVLIGLLSRGSQRAPVALGVGGRRVGDHRQSGHAPPHPVFGAPCSRHQPVDDLCFQRAKAPTATLRRCCLRRVLPEWPQGRDPNSGSRSPVLGGAEANPLGRRTRSVAGASPRAPHTYTH